MWLIFSAFVLFFHPGNPFSLCLCFTPHIFKMTQMFHRLCPLPCFLPHPEKILSCSTNLPYTKKDCMTVENSMYIGQHSAEEKQLGGLSCAQMGEGHISYLVCPQCSFRFHFEICFYFMKEWIVSLFWITATITILHHQLFYILALNLDRCYGKEWLGHMEIHLSYYQ